MKYLNRYHTNDLKLTEDGDFELDERGDFALASGNDLLGQNVTIVTKSTNPDWFGETFPADLEDLLGLENSRETAELGKTKIKEGLVRTGFFDKEDIWIEAKPNPANRNGIVFFIFIRSPFSSDALVYQLDLDLGFGYTARRVY